MADILSELGPLFLGSRLKRLGERMQADVLRVIEAAGLPIQPSQYPLLAALDRHGPLTVNAMVRMTGLSQPAATRAIGLLIDMGLVEAHRLHRDQRHKTIALTEAGRAAMVKSKLDVWPRVEAAVRQLCADLTGPLIDQIGTVEAALAQTPLDRRAAGLAALAGPGQGLSILPFCDDLAPAFHDINAQWITAMFKLEPTDVEVLKNPRSRIVDPGGDILFVAAEGLGVVGACALQKTGEGRFELTKMGVLDSARGRKAGEFLLQAVLRRAEAMGAETLYLLTNSDCAAAIHLYQKLGFVHDAEIMREFGVRYQRCNVAMRHRPGEAHRREPITGSALLSPQP